jgi:Protein of unknown function DUF2625
MNQRTLTELVDLHDPAWPLIQQWIAEAQNTVEVLPANRAQGEQTLLGLQVTTRSPMGAIALETGGILVDHSWLRFLGLGSSRMRSTLLTWNGQGADRVLEPLDGALVVAHDAVGGFFALNGGAFAGRPGSVYYFAPDRLDWEDLQRSYSDLLSWALAGELELFYATARWPGWEQDVVALSGDEGMSIYPPLWSSREPASERSRRAVPLTELWSMQREIGRQISHLPRGAQVRLQFNDESEKLDS